MTDMIFTSDILYFNHKMVLIEKGLLNIEPEIN